MSSTQIHLPQTLNEPFSKRNRIVCEDGTTWLLPTKQVNASRDNKTGALSLPLQSGTKENYLRLDVKEH